MTSIDKKMMSLALREARKGWGRTSPNPMVGAVVAKGDRIISKGFHAFAGGPHAEVVAIKKAGDAAKDATIYVTLEPCNHYGRTPPCTKAILDAGIRRVVIAQTDPNPGVRGGGADFLASQGLDVQTGLLENQSVELNVFFTKFITTGRPYVILKSAATLDGKLASSSGHSRWVTGDKARNYVHKIRNGVDAILVGRGTVQADDPTLNTRIPGKRKGRDPVRIVLDAGLKSSPEARVFNPELGGRTIAAAGPGAPREKINALEEKGVEVWTLPLSGSGISLNALIEKLGSINITSLLIEGGAEVNSAALLDDKIVDKILFFYAPKIIGGRMAPTLAGGAGRPTMNDCLDVNIEKIRRLGSDILIEAAPIY